MVNETFPIDGATILDVQGGGESTSRSRESFWTKLWP